MKRIFKGIALFRAPMLIGVLTFTALTPLLADPLLADFGLADCKILYSDASTASAAVQCNKHVSLISTGDVLHGHQVREVSDRHILLSRTPGKIVLWSLSHSGSHSQTTMSTNAGKSEATVTPRTRQEPTRPTR